MAQRQNTETKNKPSIWGVFGKIGSFLSLIFSGLMVFLSFLLAMPLFILGLIIKWVEFSIGYALFWFIADAIYGTFILNSDTFEPFTGTSVLVILIVAFLTALLTSISDIKG